MPASVLLQLTSLVLLAGSFVLKNYLPGIHTTVGIGDYENDLSLLAHADIAVAVENAIEPVKLQADMIVASNKEGAIKDLIEKLEIRLRTKSTNLSEEASI